MAENRVNTNSQTYSPRQEVLDTNATILPSTAVLAVKTLTASRTLTLPDVTVYSLGFPLIISDESGLCSSTNSIVVKNAGGLTVATLTHPNASVFLQNNGTKWISQDISNETMAAHVAAGPLASALALLSGGNADDNALTLLQISKVGGKPVFLGTTIADDFVDPSGVFTTTIETTQSLPLMTGASAPSGYAATASAAATGEDAYRAFDGVTGAGGSGGSAWTSNLGQTTPAWVQRVNPTTFRMAGYSITTRTDYSVPTAWILYGTNDNGTNLTVLDSRTSESIAYGGTKSYTIPVASRGSFTGYRLLVTATDGSNPSIAELRFFKEVFNTGDNLNTIYDATNNLISNVNPDVNTKSLLHFEGANGSTTYIDDTGRTFTGTTNISISTAQFVFGASSLFMNGGYLSSAASPDFGVGAGDFTVNARLRVTSSGSEKILMDTRYNTGQATGFCVGVNASNKVEFYNGTDNVYAYGATTLALNTWYDIEVVRSGTTVQIFLNGVLDGTYTTSTSFGTNQPLTIGACVGGPLPMIGYLDEFRFSKGIAKHTAAFTPATTAFVLLNTPAAMDLRSLTTFVPSVPSKGSIFFLAKAINDTINPNTNLLAKLSRDDGQNFATATLSVGATLASGYTIYKASNIDLSGQLAGKNIKYRIQTVGSALGIQIDGVVAAVSNDPIAYIPPIPTPLQNPPQIYGYNTIGY